MTPKKASLSIDRPLCVVGDIHGNLDALEKLLALRQQHFSDHQLVVLGDMIDRGAQSAAVLTRLQACPDTICLMGNHEAMLLQALDAPQLYALEWLSHGGLQTLNSFGLRDILADDPSLEKTMACFRQAMGETTEQWLRSLPLWLQDGNLIMCHAGLDPNRALIHQTRSDLLWGHRDFLHKSRKDDLYVAHGHYQTDRPKFHHRRISLDTGAYCTGRLSYALISGLDPARAQVQLRRII